MKRTAIFGGSFNPIHNGHLHLAGEVLQQDLADEVWLMVSPQNPFKQQANLLDEQLRLRMAQLAVENTEGIQASDFEFALPRPSYTWNTLQLLNKEFADREFRLLIGADNWALFSKWAHSEDLIQNYRIIVYPREGNNIDCQALPSTVTLLQAQLFPYSSTEIRERLQQGGDCSEMLPQCVQDFIAERGLYKR